MKKECGPGMGDMAYYSEKKSGKPKNPKDKKKKKKVDIELEGKIAFMKKKGLKF